MKRIWFVSLLLTLAVAMQAQLKVAPKMQKGDVKHYASTAVTEVPGEGTVTMQIESTISIDDATSDGYILTVENTKVTSDAKGDNVAGKMLTASRELLTGISIKIATDNYGKPLRILNYAEVHQKLEQSGERMIEHMMQALPQLGQAVSKDAMKQQLMESLTEENLLRSLQWSANPLALCGKTVMTGAQEEYLGDQGLKMKRLYFVNGQTITTNGSVNMTQDEMKALIIKTVERMLPEQADMIKQNIDQVMASGMLKIDVKDTTTYELQDDGWVKALKDELVYDTMGQQTKTTTTTTLK